MRVGDYVVVDRVGVLRFLTWWEYEPHGLRTLEEMGVLLGRVRFVLSEVEACVVEVETGKGPPGQRTADVGWFVRVQGYKLPSGESRV